MSEERKGILKKTFVKVREYLVDSTGVVKIKINPSKIIDISVSGSDVLGGDIYYPNTLLPNQEIKIKVIPISKN